MVRRADAHPDAPPRKPMSAADLGTPMMEVGVGAARDERPIPVDLDLPLAAFDPKAILPSPMTPARPVSSLIHIALNATEGMTPSKSATSEIVAGGETRVPSDAPAATGHPYVEAPMAEPAVVAPTPVPPEASEPIEAIEPSAESAQPQTIEALLRRLEQGARRRRRLGAH